MRFCIILWGCCFCWQISFAQYNYVKQWDYRYGGNQDEYSYCSFVLCNDGGFLLGGSSKSDISGDKTQPNWNNSLMYSDFWVVRLDSQGYKLWDKRFGGTGTERLQSMRQSKDNGFILGGPTFSYTTGDITDPLRGDADYWVVKIDSLGNKQWDKRFGGDMYDELNVIERTNDGGYILGGQSLSGVGGDKTQPMWNTGGFLYSDGWVVKIDSLGNKQWDKRFGGYIQDRINCILPTADGGYLLGAFSNSGMGCDKSEPNRDQSHSTGDYWIIKIDSVGNKLWDKVYGGTGQDDIQQILQISNNRYLVTGRSGSDISGNKSIYKDFWTLVLDSLGDKLSEFGFNGGALLMNVVQTNDNGYLYSGEGWDGFEIDSNVDRSIAELNLGRRQTWIIKADSTGKKQWDKTIFSPGWDGYGYSIQTYDGCYVVMSYSDSDIGGYKTQDARDNSSDYWILKFCMEPFTGIQSASNNPGQEKIQVYPNPFTADVSIALAGQNVSAATYTITNSTGKIVYQQRENNIAIGYTKMLDLSGLPNGVYFVEVETSYGKAVQRIVKQ